MKLNTEPVPDLFQKAPKPISPKTHLWLDIATSAYFITAGAFFWTRGNKRAAAAAFVNGGMVAGVSLLTDYYGNGNRPINSPKPISTDRSRSSDSSLRSAAKNCG